MGQEFGPVTVISAVTLKHGALKRRDVLQIAALLGINQGTASRQYQEVRSGKVTKIEGI